MAKDSFKYLPSEIIINILSRLPVRITAISKCVCRSWLDLLETDEFVKSYLSRSAIATTLAVLTREGKSSRCAVFELEDEITVDRSHDRRYNPLTKFNFPHRVTIEGSANGLILLRRNEVNADALYVWNPLSREYIELHCVEGFLNPQGEGVVIYGFGLSKICGQHKVVRINSHSDCHVYTLGTGSWRRVEAPRASFEYDSGMFGAFVNGNLHWLVSDSNGTSCVSCFDLETECFTTFSVPPLQGIIECECFGSLSVLRDCLCFCDSTSGDEIVIWLMKEYGDEKSWTEECVINLNPEFDRNGYTFVYPMKVFEDGDILMVWDQLLLSFYSNKTKTSQKIGVFDGGNNYIGSMLLTPSLLSLKSFPMENVVSL